MKLKRSKVSGRRIRLRKDSQEDGKGGELGKGERFVAMKVPISHKTSGSYIHTGRADSQIAEFGRYLSSRRTKTSTAVEAGPAEQEIPILGKYETGLASTCCF